MHLVVESTSLNVRTDFKQNNQITMKKNLISTLTALIFSVHVFAVPANPNPIAYTLPDGTEITIRLQGDERINWTISEDGYTMLFNADGFLEYAIHDNFGDLKLSGVHAKDENARTTNEQGFLKTLSKNLQYSSSQKEAMLKAKGFRDKSVRKGLFDNQEPRNLRGTIRIPIILVQFQDVKFSKTKADFEMLLNQLNYTQGGATGSLRDYFSANSYGKMDLQVDIFGPYTLPENIAAYSEDCSFPSQGNPREMARLAIDSAYRRGNADFSNYVLNGRDTLDVVHIIFAGYGLESSGTNCQSIWAHADVLTRPVEYNGTTLQNYSCTSELRGNSGKNISHIGVIAHELGHSLLGVPDFYDADYANSGGVSVHLGDWCLMANGSWSNNGATPPFLSAYARWFAGWMEEITLPEEPADVLMPNPRDTGVIYRINTKTENEYFLIENRQKTSWDAYIPSSGMLIYHVNRNHSGWRNNSVNDSPLYRGYYVKQAGCNKPNGCLGSGDSPSLATDSWPQTGQSAFTDNSMPNSKSWAGDNTEKPITKIKRNTNDRTVSFKFMGGILPTHNDAVLTDLQLPQITLEEKSWDINVNLENRGLPITSALFTWQINGEEQTPFQWTGELPYEELTRVNIGSVNLPRGAHRISVTVSINNDSIPENNTISTTLTVLQPFFTEDFETSTSEWIFANGTQTNTWHIGSATSSQGEKSAYISNNENDNQYTVLNGVSKVHFYCDVEFPVSTDSFDLYFDFKGMGQTNFTGTSAIDYMELRIIETDVTPKDSVDVGEGISLGIYVNQNTWQNVHKTLSPTYSGTTKRLVFSWYNDRTNGTQPPAAVDNIVLTHRPELPTFHGIVLSQNSLHTFASATHDYDEVPDALTVAITNIGTESTGQLNIALSGENAGSFELSTTTILDIDTSAIFKVVPNIGLAVGTHTATVTVSGNPEISKQFDVSFTVNQQPSSIANAEKEMALVVYPNPVINGQLTIIARHSREGGNPPTVEIYDMTGKRVYSAKPNSTSSIVNGTFTINVSHLPAGTYIVKIGDRSAKIIKR